MHGNSIYRFFLAALDSNKDNLILKAVQEETASSSHVVWGIGGDDAPQFRLDVDKEDIVKGSFS